MRRPPSPKPQSRKKKTPRMRPGADLDERSQGDRASRADDFFQIDLEPDHEEEKNEPELGDGGDAIGRGDQARPGRPEGETGDEIGEQNRLPKLLRHQPEEPGGGDAEGDVANEFVHEGETVRRVAGR